MRPIYVVVVAAVLGVGALLFFLMESDSERTGGRGHAITGTDGDGSREGESSDGPSTEAGQRDRERSQGEIGLTIIVKSSGAAAADATVVLTGPRVWRGVTDKDGRAFAPWLIPGKYAVVASQGRKAAAQSLELHDEDQELELTLSDGIAVRGTIMAADGSPIGGARIHAEPTSEQTSAAPKWGLSWLAMSAHPAIFAETHAGDDGKYELMLPAAGSYTLRVNARRFGGASERPQEYTEPVDGLDFYLQPGSELDGQVIDEQGGPVAGALVVVNSSARGSQHSTIAVTDGDGKFALAAVLGSWSHMMVRARGYASATVGIVRPPAHGLRVTLDRGATYRVRFVAKGTDEPIEGVEAMLQTGGGGAVATSNADGEVRFENVAMARGSFGSSWRSLTAACKGFVPMQKNLSQTQAVDGVIDAGDIELERGATIRGRVTDSSTGNGIEGADVRAFSMRLMRFQNTPITSAKSDAEGRFEITGAPDDTVGLLALHKDFTGELTRQEMFALTRDPKNRLLAPGQLLLEHDMQLSPTQVARGTVLGPNGQPLPGARVTGPWRPGSTGAASTSTGKDGRFELPGYAKDRTIQLRATHRDYGGAATAAMKVGGDEDPVLRLQKAVVVQGRVLDPEGKPVVGVTVTLSSPPTEKRGSRRNAPITGATNADGVFVIRNGLAGERMLRFDHSQFQLRSRMIDVADNGEAFDAGTTTLDRGLGLGGRVLDEAGAGVSGVMVSASYVQQGGGAPPPPPIGPGGSRRTPPSQRTNASVTTNREGRFRMWGLKDGSYRITATVAGRYASSPTAATGEFDVRVDVKNPATIHGRVLSGGDPVRGAWVQATQPGANPKQPRWLSSASSAEDGTFSLGPLPPEGTFNLKVTHTEYRTLELEGISAAAAQKEFVLDAGAAISGTVVDDAGKPIVNANLSVVSTEKGRANAMKWTRTKEDGSFRATGLEPGSYRVTVTWTAERHAPNDPVEADADGEHVKIVLVAGKSIKGTIRTDDPAKLGQVRVLAIDKDGNTQGTAWIWGARTLKFNMAALRPGEYTMKVVRGWGPNEEVLAEVPGVQAGDENVEITIRG